MSPRHAVLGRLIGVLSHLNSESQLKLNAERRAAAEREQEKVRLSLGTCNSSHSVHLATRSADLTMSPATVLPC